MGLTEEGSNGVTETFVEAGRRGKNTWLRYLLGIVFVLFMWFVVGGWASLSVGSLLGVSVGQIATESSSAGPIAGYLVISASFVPFLVGTLLAVALVHRRNPLTLVTGRSSVDWGRVGTGPGVWFALAVLAGLVGFLVYPSSCSFGASLAAFVPFALLALVLTPLQATAEELFFRGYLVQGAGLISSNFLFLALASGVLPCCRTSPTRGWTPASCYSPSTTSGSVPSHKKQTPASPEGATTGVIESTPYHHARRR